MTRSSRKSVRNGTIGFHERPQADFHREDDAQTTGDASFQSLITSAILTATAFRLRDQDGLTLALRTLVQAVKPFEAKASED